MGFCCFGSSSLKSWLSLLRGRLLLRLIGLPIALFAWHLELYGYSSTSLFLHRLSRYLQLPIFLNFLLDHGVGDVCYIGGITHYDPKLALADMARKRSATQATPEPASGGAASPRAPPPAEHIAAPSTPFTTNTLSHPSPSTTSHPSHSRSMSSADLVRDGKRLSLNFPVTPAAGSTSPSRSRPQSWVATPITSPEILPSPTEGSFLTVLAAQERRVLELKEELNKAERDLVDLKKQWTRHEGLKQRNEVRRVQQLQPLNTGLANVAADDDDQDGSSAWMQKEMERRKALLSNTKTSQRKVFSGSRHTRTLSLLSPDKVTYTPSFPQPADVRQSLDETLKRQPLTRTSTAPDIATTIANSIKDERYDLSSIQRDILLQTGKRVAIDLKDGLMTFLEDLRQATVGDEAIQQLDDSEGRPNAKRQSSKASLKSGRPSLNRNASLSNKHSGEDTNLIDISESFWKENGLDEPKAVTSTKVKKTAKKTPQTPQKSSQKINDGFEDSWDTWDTPNEQHTTESSNESDSEDSARSSPRTSTSSTGLGVATPDTTSNRNSIPWPDLVKLSPNNLKRTASHLMKEWEKSLTPPAESREASHASGDYVGRSASPVRKA